jgi:[ribosomal protein S5]-alanine N-acetyltransferase
VERKDTREPIGICGLLKRDALPEPDVGFAFLPRFRGQGYARESAEAVLEHARAALGLTRVLAITTPGNTASIQLLGRMGFTFEGTARLSAEDEVRVFVLDRAGPG